MNKKFFFISLATILTASTVTFAQEAPAPSAAPVQDEAAAQEEAQKTLLYKVACLSNSELVMDQELVNTVGANEQLTTLRENFQSFAKDPAAFLSTQISQYDDMKKQAVDYVTKNIPADELQAQTETYAKEKNVSIDEAKAIVIDRIADQVIAQHKGQFITRKSVIVNASMQSCGLIKFLEPKIAATGCKTPVGSALDLSSANGICQAISTPAKAIANASGQIAEIQQQAQMALQIISDTVKQGVDAQAAPIIESMKAPQSEIVATITDFISAAQAAIAPAPVAVP